MFTNILSVVINICNSVKWVVVLKTVEGEFHGQVENRSDLSKKTREKRLRCLKHTGGKN